LASKGKIDLNLDAGESADAQASGLEEQLFQLVTSVNVACGGHAGDDKTMRFAVELAKSLDLAVGAHPSYPDPENFGREKMEIDTAVLAFSLTEQIRALEDVCNEFQVPLTHVKPHGALYHSVSEDRKVANAFFEAVRRVNPNLPVVGFAGSEFLEWAKANGFKTLREGFVDRRYDEDGRLKPRSEPGALIEDLVEAGDQAVSLVPEVDTLCIHGDTPNALRIARAVCAALSRAGVRIDRATT
jgi:UPF0271 protein